MTLLFVEDERLTRDGIALQIRKDFNLQVLTASNGYEGFEVFKQHNPEIVITDIKMPVWDGLELIRNIRTVNGNTAISILTAYADFEYAQHAIRYGVHNFLVKPVTVSMLKKEVTELLDKCDSEAVKEKARVCNTYSNYLHGIVSPSREEASQPMLLYGFDLILNQASKYPFSVLDSGMINYAVQNIAQELFENLKAAWQLVIENHRRFYLLIFYAANPSEKKNEETVRQIDNVCRQLNLCINDTLGIRSTMTQSKPALLRDVYPTYLSVNHKLSDAAEHEYVFQDTAPIKDAEKSLLAAVKNQDLPSLEPLVARILEPADTIYKKKLMVLRFVYYLFGALQQELESRNLQPENILSMLNLNQRMNEEILKKRTTECLAKLSDRISKQNCRSVHPVIRHIEQDVLREPSKQLLLKDFAQRYRINPTYLSELFVSELGETFSDFVSRVKLEEGKRLLSRPEIKVYEVAMQLGYNDGRYFSQMFKKYTGMSPKEYQYQQNF